jgi:hypothetical protein
LLTRKQKMDPIKNEPATKAAQAKNRNVAFILGGWEFWEF